jgi:hypothetical protein
MEPGSTWGRMEKKGTEKRFVVSDYYVFFTSVIKTCMEIKNHGIPDI